MPPKQFPTSPPLAKLPAAFAELTQLFFVFFIVAIFCAPVMAAKARLHVEISDAFVDMRTGPGKAYPVFYVAQRGQVLEIVKRRTQWFKVRLAVGGERTKTGWVHFDGLANTRVTDSQQLASADKRLSYVFDSPWSAGFLLGNLADSDLLTAYLAYNLTKNYSLELHGTQYFGLTEEGWFVNGIAQYTFYPDWWVSPYMQLGVGYVEQDFKGLVKLKQDTDDNFFQSGAGLDVRITARYRLRFEYKHLNVLTSSDDNEEIELWQVGFGATF